MLLLLLLLLLLLYDDDDEMPNRKYRRFQLVINYKEITKLIISARTKM